MVGQRRRPVHPASTTTAHRAFRSKGRSIAWHLLANHCDSHDLGAEHFNRLTDPEARKHYLIRQLEALGHTVTVEPNAASATRQ